MGYYIQFLYWIAIIISFISGCRLGFKKGFKQATLLIIDFLPDRQKRMLLDHLNKPKLSFIDKLRKAMEEINEKYK